MFSSFGPIGNSSIISLTSSSQRFALTTLAAVNPAIRLISLNPSHLAWYVRFGDNTVTVSTTTGMRADPAGQDMPLVLAVPTGATHVAILAEGGADGDAQLSCGGFLDGEFSPIGASVTAAVTQTDQRVTLPALGVTGPCIRIVSMSQAITALWIKLGNGSVTGDVSTSMKVAPGSVDKPTFVPVTNGETHLSIFSDGIGGDVVITSGDLLGAKGDPGTDGVNTGLIWNFDSATAMADPGTGDFRLNNATLSSVTAAAFDDLTGMTGNPDASAWVLSWDDSTNTVKGTLIIKKIGAEQNFAIYNVTGLTDNSGWTQIALTYVTHSGSFTNGDPCSVLFVRAGDRGFSRIVIQRITATGTYTPTAGTSYCIAEAKGSGGGGGGADTLASSYAAAGGGGEGEYARGVFTAADIGASQAVTIGAGGAAGNTTGGNGGTGGTVSFGALLTAIGGAGGTGTGNADNTEAPRAGGAGGTGGTGGQVRIAGAPGEPGHAQVANTQAIGGNGGGSGGGAGAVGIGTQLTAGTAGQANSGGGGGGGSAGSSTNGAAGGAGGTGDVTVTDFII